MKALKLSAVFFLALAAWTAFWIVLTTFTMWHFTWPGMWDAPGRLAFAVLGLFTASVVTAFINDDLD